MNIIEALKSEDVRVVLKNNFRGRWMLWDFKKKKWIVNETGGVKSLIEIKDESEAVAELLKS